MSFCGFACGTARFVPKHVNVPSQHHRTYLHQAFFFLSFFPITLDLEQYQVVGPLVGLEVLLNTYSLPQNAFWRSCRTAHGIP